jgi:hypothetical protein
MLRESERERGKETKKGSCQGETAGKGNILMWPQWLTIIEPTELADLILRILEGPCFEEDLEPLPEAVPHEEIDLDPHEDEDREPHDELDLDPMEVSIGVRAANACISFSRNLRLDGSVECM